MGHSCQPWANVPQPQTSPPYQGPMPLSCVTRGAARGAPRGTPSSRSTLRRSCCWGSEVSGERQCKGLAREGGTDGRMPSTHRSQNSESAGIPRQPPPHHARQASFPSSPTQSPPPRYLRNHLNRLCPWVSKENELAPAAAVRPAQVPCLPQPLDQPPLQRGWGGSAPLVCQHPPSLLCLTTVAMATKPSHPIG